MTPWRPTGAATASTRPPPLEKRAADRPILACIDREQRELGGSGTTRRVLEPSLSAAEREAALSRQRARDMIRRDQALITRYPDPAAHDAARRAALAQTQAVVDAATQRIAGLAEKRKARDDEMEFYRRDPARLRQLWQSRTAVGAGDKR
jgi:hypothetical protein